MKTIDEREMQKQKQKKNKQRQKGARGKEAIVKGWELNNFVVLNGLGKYWLIFIQGLFINLVIKWIVIFFPFDIQFIAKCN